MALFSKKKKEVCGCQAGAEVQEERPCCCKSQVGIDSVQVLGSGCKSCHALLEAAQEAVRALGLPLEVEYVTDLEAIMASGVMRMPALTVNHQVQSMGKVLKAREVEEILKQFL